MQTVFTIPLPPHLVKFCRRSFFLHAAAEPYKVTESDLLGKQILLLLLDRRTHSKPLPYFTDSITIELSHALAKRSPSQLKLNRLYISLEKIWRYTMLTYIGAHIELGLSRYAAAKSFFKAHAIDDDETLFQTSYTFVTRVTNRQFHANVSKRLRKLNETAVEKTADNQNDEPARLPNSCAGKEARNSR